METLETKFKELGILYLFGREIAPTTGTPHLQGYIESLTKIRPVEKLKLPFSMNWEKCKGSRQDNLEYCAKEGTDLRFCKEFKPARKLKLIEPYGWQTQVVDIVQEEPDERTIHWFWEPRGRVGKTSLCKWLIMKEGAIVTGGKAADVQNCICMYLKDMGHTPELIIMNIAKTQENFVSYQGIENCKDMMFYSGKYEGGQVCGPSPHLIVFANFAPEESKLSADRWNVVRINVPDTDGMPSTFE